MRTPSSRSAVRPPKARKSSVQKMRSGHVSRGCLKRSRKKRIDERSSRSKWIGESAEWMRMLSTSRPASASFASSSRWKSSEPYPASITCRTPVAAHWRRNGARSPKPDGTSPSSMCSSFVHGIPRASRRRWSAAGQCNGKMKSNLSRKARSSPDMSQVLCP